MCKRSESAIPDENLFLFFEPDLFEEPVPNKIGVLLGLKIGNRPGSEKGEGTVRLPRLPSWFTLTIFNMFSKGNF
jgi:hypothetical protein